MSKINIHYWLGSPDNNFKPNFGDALNPFMIENLSGMKSQYKSLSKKEIVQNLLSFDGNKIKSIEWPWQRTIVPIGSIISTGNNRSLIWGSGFMKSSDTIFRGGKTFAVRGKLTDQKLQDLGFPSCSVYGDPALLLPLVIPPAVKKEYKLGIIPHWTEADAFIKKFGDKYKIIDLRSDDVIDVVNQITSCEYVLSTSLHGVIVSHAYGIPALWIKEGYIHTDGFKFKDYFSSVNIPFYDGFENVEKLFENEEAWLKLFSNNEDKIKLNTDLNKLQQNLLKAAPFPIKKEFLK